MMANSILGAICRRVAHRVLAITAGPSGHTNALALEAISTLRAVVHASGFVAGKSPKALCALAGSVLAHTMTVAIVGTVLNGTTHPTPSRATVALVLIKDTIE